MKIDVPTVSDYPYYATIEFNGLTMAAAAIVDRNWVIASGVLCIDNFKEEYRIRVGTDVRDLLTKGIIESLGQGGSVHQIEKMVQHENRSGKLFGDDVCLIKVKEPFEFDETRQQVTLPKPGDKMAPGTRANLTGLEFLKVQEDWLWTYPFIEKLQSAGMYILDTGKCIEALESKLDSTTPEGKICASYYVYPKDKEYVCWLNLGGTPLTIEGLLVGLFSYTDICDEPNQPVLFTDIAYYRDWIDQHLTSDRNVPEFLASSWAVLKKLASFLVGLLGSYSE